MTQEIKFTYPAEIVELCHNTSGLLEKVTVRIDVEGRYFLVKVPPDVFICEIEEDKRVMCEGILEEGKKTLRFRDIVPIKLSEEQIVRLKKIVSSFKSI
jgi:hypothetical protein